MVGFRHVMMTSAAVCAVMAATPALAEVKSFDIPAQSARTAIPEFGRQSGLQILAAQTEVGDQQAPAIKGEYDTRQALGILLAATNLKVASDDGRTVTLAQDPQGGSAGGGAEGNAVDALIVTAQKKEENIQDVPIAISAFSQKALDEQKIEGGFDLLKAIPNVTFSKNNFSSYNFSIRGVGTKAISVATDPGVAVSFNNTTLIRNRLFEQEYVDIERVEVLRGPQGTLYGRNATAGVVNVITAKPKLSGFEGFIKGEVGNFHAKRLSAAVNVPLVEDVLAVRLAGALTSRDGYGYNEYTKGPTDGRDLWSARLSVSFEPTERLRANAIWERFEEDDDRTRTGKQLCHRDPGTIGGEVADQSATAFALGAFSQGCLPGSLYDQGAFGTPNGQSLPFLRAAGAGYTADYDRDCVVAMGFPFPECTIQIIGNDADPYGGRVQSSDLRSIYSKISPKYLAESDLFQLNMEFDLSPGLTVYSQTLYGDDKIYSTQDFNRYTTFPVFGDTENAVMADLTPSVMRPILPKGIFCDPQLGCSDTVVGQDISRATSEQFSQELRLQSDFDGPVNFSLGANYTEYETVEDYFVLFNAITMDAMVLNAGRQYFPLPPGEPLLNPTSCPGAFFEPCVYIDPNPLESINGEGHNYFRSKNPYEFKSWGVFGEAYWEIREGLKVTAGLRYTKDRKHFTPVPSQTLLSPATPEAVEFFDSFPSPGYLDVAKALYGLPGGYPEAAPIVQEWGEYTGRLAIDWHPELSFTDDTMLYASYSRGYKGGGANPPQIGNLIPKARSVPVTFEPEFVDAFEIGSKNTLLDGGLVLNATAFFYNYDGYQISKIVERTAANENFDAEVWGLEFETLFQPVRNLRLNANLGYLNTRIKSGLTIDLMNRTQGDPDWTVIKPPFTLSSNCVVPTTHVAAQFEDWLGHRSAPNAIYEIQNLCFGTGNFIAGPYNPLDHPEINFGAGYYDDVRGNELPNAPHWTANIGAQYGMDILDGWRATVRTDAYWQSQSWARVHNAVNDKLHGWYNANLSVWLERPDDGLKIELYAKNILNDTPITDAFLNSDDTALTTNIFVLDPRLIGLSIRKEF